MIEIIHSRDSDYDCEIELYVDGVAVGEFELYDIDPGKGYPRADWDEHTELVVSVASPAVAERLRQLRDAVAENSPYIEERR